MADDYEIPVDGESIPEGQDGAGIPIKKLLAHEGNLVELIDEQQLGIYGSEVWECYDNDLRSRSHREEELEMGMNLAMQVVQKKNYPWPGASSVKYPLITSAIMDFGAQAYGAVLPEGDWVKAVITATELQDKLQPIADDGCRVMNDQLKDDMPEWEEETDKLIHMLPAMGFVIRQTYYDEFDRQNVSEIVFPKNFIINYMAKDLVRSPCTKVFDLYDYEIEERIRSGFYDVDFKYKGLDDDSAENQVSEGLNKNTQRPEGDTAKSGLHGFGEHHGWLDLDKDGLPEPYVITFHLQTRSIARIDRRYEEADVTFESEKKNAKVVKIKPEVFFTKYSFLPAPDGSFYDMGFGTLLLSTNDAINGLINQVMDAGHQQIVGGGLIGKGIRMKSGTIKIKPGEYKMVDSTGDKLAGNIWDKPLPQINPAMFQLIQLLIDAGDKMSTVKDLLTDENTNNMAATVAMALVEQGLTGFKSIYKRIYRAMRKEFARLAELNGKYMTRQKLSKADKDGKASITEIDGKLFSDYKGIIRYVPVNDVDNVSRMQAAARAQFYMSFKGDPMIDQKELYTRVFSDMNIKDATKLFAPPPTTPPPPDPATVLAGAQATALQQDSQTKRMTAITNAHKNLADIRLKEAQAIEALANAEKAIGDTDLAPLETAYQHLDKLGVENGSTNQEGTGLMAPGPNDQASPPVS